MKKQLPNALLASCVTACLAGAVNAQVLITSNIATSTTWTANNVYRLQDQIYVLPGATLTIEAGTVIASTAGLGGSLAVTRGAQIHVLGTERRPVIFTSTNDTATWTGGNPKTGTWRAAANEWGNLTIMGDAYISENVNPATNSPAPSSGNYAIMEGLVAASANDPNIRYGGGNDNDDSGTIKYASFRYGGKVIALTNELNGLSLGGVGRGTEIHHVEIMNNVDDGVEIWGGTVNLKHVSIWNIGDDSFDVDQGWRGAAQFVFIVQGYSVPAGQGSGWGDNAFEIDGAEQSHYQPVTTTTIYNATVVGCPTTPVTGGLGGSDHGMAFRDNARVQYRNCVFMNIGERVVSFDNVDGDGGAGYGHSGTLGWPAVWTTPYSATSTVNAPANPGAFYTVQTSGTLCEVSDSVFYGNAHSSAYTEWNSLGLGAFNNVVEPAGMPIQAITRAAPVIVSGANSVARVSSIDPLPANSALTSVAYATPGGFFESARYRGAFAPGNNWLVGWSAADAFGMLVHDGWTDLGNTTAGVNGAPIMDAAGSLQANVTTTFSLTNAAPNAVAALLFGFLRSDTSLQPYGFAGVTAVPNFNTLGYVVVITNASGNSSTNFTLPGTGYSGLSFYEQYLVFDPAATASNGLAASNAIYRISQ